MPYLAAGAAAVLLWALRCREAARLARLGAPALLQALARARSPFEAARALAAHAAAALGVPAERVSLLVYDCGLACRGYVVRAHAPLPAQPSAMEVLPAWALQDGALALREGGSGERVERVSASLGSDCGSGEALGLLVVLLPAGGPPQQLQQQQRLLQALAACAEARLQQLLLPPLQPSSLPLPPLPPPPGAVEPTWEWDVFGSLPLLEGHWPDYEAEEQRQFARATGAGAVATCSRGSLAAAARCGEARLQAAVLEMLCGRRTAALLGPGLRPPAPALAALAARLRPHYRANPFHNFYHAVGVLHGAWVLAGAPGVAARLGPLGVLALLLAALAHDAGHPGHSNSLECALGTPRALRHSGASVLERHHAATLEALLAGCSELQQALAGEARGALRSLCLGAVLATDLAQHEALLEALGEARLAACAPAAAQATLVAALLHAADLGGMAARSLRAQRNCAARIRAEFRSQAALERALGLPPSPHMQGLECERAFAASQVQFLSRVALPLWQRLHEALGGGLQEPMDNMRSIAAAFAERAGEAPPP
jgi:hypothetical protein